MIESISMSIWCTLLIELVFSMAYQLLKLCVQMKLVSCWVAISVRVGALAIRGCHYWQCWCQSFNFQQSIILFDSNRSDYFPQITRPMAVVINPGSSIQHFYLRWNNQEVLNNFAGACLQVCRANLFGVHPASYSHQEHFKHIQDDVKIPVAFTPPPNSQPNFD